MKREREGKVRWVEWREYVTKIGEDERVKRKRNEPGREWSDEWSEDGMVEEWKDMKGDVIKVLLSVVWPRVSVIRDICEAHNRSCLLKYVSDMIQT